MNNVLILTYWSYPDALIQTYTLPYVRIIRKNLPPGSSVFLLTLEKDQAILEKSNRDKIAEQLQNEGIHWLPFTYRPFGFSAFILWMGISFKLCSIIIGRKISVIHCWCTTAGAIGYFLSVVFNRKLIIDSYEPHAEAMIENGTWKKGSLAFRLLFWLEKKQTQRAEVVISATEGMRGYALSKYNVSIKNFYVKPACVDLDLFSEKDIKNKSLLMQLELSDKIVCVYAGKFGGIYLEDEVFDFLKVAYDHWGDAFRVLLLTNTREEKLKEYCNRANIPFQIVISLFVPHAKIPSYLGLADFALCPVKPIPTKRYCTPIKNGEYWALGLPVIIPKGISDDAQIIQENSIGAVWTKLEKQEYVLSVAVIDSILQTPPSVRFRKIREIAIQYRSFKIAETVYNQVYMARS